MNEKQYERISEPFRNESKKKMVLLLNKLLTSIGYISYPILLVLTFINNQEMLIKTILIPAIGFVLLTFVRKGINKKRPYETLNIKPIIQKNKQGNSMPSRHVFSMTMIALSWFTLSPLVGSILILASIVLGMIRVIGGVHYPSDVFVGFMSAIIWGLGFLI